MRLKSLVMSLIISSAIFSINTLAVTLNTVNQSKILGFQYSFTENDGSFSHRPPLPYDGNGIFTFNQNSKKSTATITIYPANAKSDDQKCIIKIEDIKATLVQVPSQNYTCKLDVWPDAATVTLKDK